MKFRSLFYFFLILQLFMVKGAIHDSQALEFSGACVRFLRSVLDFTKENLTEDFSRKTIRLDQNLTIQMGERLGSGISASVYEIITLNGKVPDHRIVAKLNHRWRTTKREIPFSKKQINIELNSYELKDQYSLPAIPIEAKYTFHETPILLKPYVEGTNLKSLILQYKKAENLPKNYLEKLKDLYLIQKQVHKDKKIWIDLNTTNLLWVSDPAQLSVLKLNEPTMVLFEVSEGPNVGRIFPKNHQFKHFLKYLDDIK